MKRIFFFLLIVLISVSGKAQFGQGPQSKVVRDSIFSKVLNAQRQFTVYLPKSYEVNKDKKYPILYLLHGVYGIDQDWFLRGHAKDVADQLMASGEACEMIIVSPNAGGNPYAGDWNGYFDMPGWSYETFFYKEFLPYIESHYRVVGDKQHRAIAGLSMGGGGTTCYSQHHSDMYCAAYAMSALMDIPQTGAVPSKDPGDKMSILNQSVTEHSCIKYVVNADDAAKTQLKTIKWFIDCGDDDFLFDRNIEFIQAMHKAGIPCEFRVRDGGHTWEYWHSALYNCLPFVTRAFYGI